MVATSVNNLRGIEALTRVKEIVTEHGSDEQLARLDAIMGGPIPAPANRPIEHAAYQDAALVVLFEMVGELKAANAPRKRGRPRKGEAA